MISTQLERNILIPVYSVLKRNRGRISHLVVHHLVEHTASHRLLNIILIYLLLIPPHLGPRFGSQIGNIPTTQFEHDFEKQEHRRIYFFDLRSKIEVWSVLV